MKRTIFIFSLLLCLPLAAQQTYRARVVDSETGEALPYAQVYVSEGNGSLTDGDGWFTVEAKPTDMLSISYIGYNALQVKASEMRTVIQLRPMSITMQEVTVIPAEAILMKMFRRLNKEYKYKARNRSNYFYRLTNTYAGKMELVEAYLNACSMGNLRDVIFTAGRRLKKTQYTDRSSSISFSNLQKLLEIGPVMWNNSEWGAVLMPFTLTQNYNNIYAENGQSTRKLDKKHYIFSGQVLEDSNGERLYKITMQCNSDNAYIDGVVYVDAKKYRLLRFEGELHNFTLELGKDFRRETGSVQPNVCITYSHRHGFTEVESIVATMEVGDLQSRSVMMSMDEHKLPFKKGKYKQEYNMMEAIDQTRPDTALWRAANIQRTEAEERLVRQQGMSRTDLGEWMYAKRDETYDDAGPLRPYLERLAAFGKTIPQEKVYIHMDNTCYFQGDTIWFAAYTRQTTDDRPSRVSGVLYVELLNNDGYLVERKMIEMKRGRGNGFFALNKQIQYSGFYELRAYTRWQLNWGQYVHKHCQDMEPYFYNKGLERAFYTDYEKLYSRVFPVYDEPLDSGDYTHRMTLRVLRRTFKNDPDVPQPTLALFPEGGNLVAGVPNRVAFEAVMSDGQWLKGNLKASPLTLDSVANAQLAIAPRRGEVPAVNRGRGVFTIVPERGIEREVTFTTEDGQTVKARLPKPEERGVALQVRQEGDSTHIVLHLAGVSSDSLAMTIMHEGKVSLLRTMTKGLGFSFHNSTMPCGVNQVTVFDTEGHVWADRLFFVRKREEMLPTLSVSGAKEEYLPYDSIGLDIQGKAGEATISLTVRDGYQADALYDNASILTEMLLSSEIRGFVPNPGWYFEADDSLRRVALDLLMMTQGWRRFNWRDMAVRGAWDLTQPSEQTPIIIGKVRPNPRRNIINTLEAEQYYDWLEKRVDEINDEDESPEENSSEQDPKDISRESQGDIKAKAASKRPKKHNPLRIHVEYVPANTLEPKIHEMDTKDYNFRFQLPHTYGKGVLFISVADTTTWKKRKKPYTWIQMAGTAGELALHHQRKLDTEEAEYRAYVAWPYPRFVRPFDYHHVHLMEVKDDSALLQTLRSDSIHQMQQVTVKARRKNRLARFNDAFPALSMDAYEAWNMIDDAGMVNLYDSYAYFARVLVSDYGQASIHSTDAIGNTQRIYEQFGISPIRRSLPQYRDIPTDSLYHPKYLTSIGEGFEFSPGERRQYWGDERIDEDWRFLIDRYVLYTDYQPRLEGSKRYAGANLPETRVAIYPFYDGSKRVVYRDRRYVLDGFAAPAEFYSPNYSRYKLPEGQKDYRRTLYWNPNLQLDSEGRARVTLYNNSRTTQIQVEAAGQAADGTLLWNK